MDNLVSKCLNNMDAFRVFRILLIITGYVSFGGKFDHYIYAFHTPMFFISGCFFEEVKRKSKTILVFMSVILTKTRLKC